MTIPEFRPDRTPELSAGPAPQSADTPPRPNTETTAEKPNVGTPKYERHKLSAVWPDADASETEQLRSAMKRRGFDRNEPIMLFEEQVLDGWRRYQVALDVGVPSVFEQFTGSYDDAVDYVVERHVARRNLTPKQRADAIVASARWYQSGQRPRRSGVQGGSNDPAPGAPYRPGEPWTDSGGSNDPAPGMPAERPGSNALTTEQMARKVNVSTGTIKRAKAEERARRTGQPVSRTTKAATPKPASAKAEPGAPEAAEPPLPKVGAGKSAGTTAATDAAATPASAAAAAGTPAAATVAAPEKDPEPTTVSDEMAEVVRQALGGRIDLDITAKPANSNSIDAGRSLVPDEAAAEGKPWGQPGAGLLVVAAPAQTPEECLRTAERLRAELDAGTVKSAVILTRVSTWDAWAPHLGPKMTAIALLGRETVGPWTLVGLGSVSATALQDACEDRGVVFGRAPLKPADGCRRQIGREARDESENGE